MKPLKHFESMNRVWRENVLNRFPIRQCNKTQTVASHSWFVAMLAAYIAQHTHKYNMGDLLLRAICHDVPEVVTSDLPHFIKHYNEQMEENVKTIEEEVILNLTDMMPDQDVSDIFYTAIKHAKNTETPEGQLIMVCDLMDIMFYLANERASGNRQDWLDPVFDGVLKLIKNTSSKFLDDKEQKVVNELITGSKKIFGKLAIRNDDTIGKTYAKKAAEDRKA